jgi:hypothetical protein
MDYHDANRELVNWGRAVHDGWLREFILYQAPPTSTGYLAPTNAFDEPERPRQSIDLQLAEMTERVVIEIGRSDFQSYKVLIYWYPKLMAMNRDDVDLRHEDRIKMLSKEMHTSFRNAESMLTESVCRYIDSRFTS